MLSKKSEFQENYGNDPYEESGWVNSSGTIDEYAISLSLPHSWISFLDCILEGGQQMHNDCVCRIHNGKTWRDAGN